MTEFHCEECGVVLDGDEVMCGSCGEAYLRECGPTMFLDGVEVSKGSQVYDDVFDAVFS